VCQIIPQAVFNYLCRKQTTLVLRALDAEERKFRKIKQDDDEKKQKHLRNFRPNLENPANKVLT
jgi:DNA-binding HxlR family transcriptional regulator